MSDFKYKDERIMNSQYRFLLEFILGNGEWTTTRQGPRTKVCTGMQMRFDLLSDGFPLITERKIGFWRKPINELGAMINGVRTAEDFAAWGCDWWGDWVTEEKCAKRGLKTGDIGPASYGAMFHDWPDEAGQTYDQFAHLVQQITEFPYDKTHVVSPWYGAWLARDSGRINKATIAPCHGWVQVTVIGDKLHLHMTQRSGDVPVGVPSNMVQYAALQLLLCRILGYTPGQYVHTIVNAHIYEDQVNMVEEMLSRKPRRLPTMQLVDGIGDFVPPTPHDSGLVHKLHGDLFVLNEYDPHPAIAGIPVAV